MYFEGVASGITLSEIARRINKAGFRTYTGDMFKITSFDTWAYNRKYKGDYTWDVSSKKDEEGKRNGHSPSQKNEAIEKKTFLESRLDQAKSIKATDDINEETVIKILEIKKHLLFSDQVENKKQVLYEYIDSVYVSHSKDDGINVKLNVRVFNGGGDLTLYKTLHYKS
ncbi:recombinase family protein [Desulfosporosinus sp.]|uniref:recombinase family protein n=1 Tax=Desulfosporosinus sp. TaxID=157907 RepID=UPI00231F5163|nr:recombinase family protein [Desulfosporosinus sp.]MDA8220996.1 recombinase family protein [Desulfitobacterium hafniense]